MNTLQHLIRHLLIEYGKITAIIVGFVGIFIGSVIIASTLPITPAERRANAYQRWKDQALERYEIALYVDFLDQSCFQKLEIEGNRINNVIADTCKTSSSTAMTIDRLFELSERAELPSSCYADGEPCACKQVRYGHVSYDKDLGIPTEISYGRLVTYNPSHLDFWKSIAKRKNLPECKLQRTTDIAVISFSPVP
jgi:hypothetical protein